MVVAVVAPLARRMDGGKGFLGRPPAKTADQIKAQSDRKDAQQAEVKRRMDTRRKIILGGMLVELAKYDPAARKLVQSLVENLERPSDLKPFKDWTPGT